MTRVKICGITDTLQALAAAEAGADYLGLVFAHSRRRIIPIKAAEIVKAVKQPTSSPAVVGVFVNTPAADVNFIAEACRLDWVQISGDESWEYCREIQKPVIKVIHIFNSSTAVDIREGIKKGYRCLPGDRFICLLDTQIKGSYGGTGQAFDWQLAGEISAQYPVIIAGGLTPDNVGELIAQAHPWGVDVSSGVETGGQKDVLKIREFVRKVKGLGEINSSR
jgi:phosphoribosylanthranilate isomerase